MNNDYYNNYYNQGTYPYTLNQNATVQQMSPYVNQMYMQQPQQSVQNTQPNYVAAAQTQQMNQYVPSRIIDNINDVKPNEVPSDGSPVLFPLKDRSGIYLKELTQNGTIATSMYIRVDEATNQEQPDQNNVLETVLARLDNIETMLKKSTAKTRYYPSKKKQGGNQNE